MWPLHILLNKLLKIEGHEDHEEERNMSFAESYDFKPVLGHSHFVEVPHIKQLRSWDCGLACVLMVLKTLGLNHFDIQDLEEMCSTTSIWTVDLAYLLQKLSIRFSYFTVTLGANPDFSVETFYKEQLATDIERVDTLFQRSVEEGIKIECRSIKGEEIIFLILSGKYVVIALVDQCILSYVVNHGRRMLFICHSSIMALQHIPVIMLLYVAMMLIQTNLRSEIQLVLGKVIGSHQNAWKKLVNPMAQMKIFSWYRW